MHYYIHSLHSLVSNISSYVNNVCIFGEEIFARSIPSPLLLTQTKFISNRKQTSSKKVPDYKSFIGGDNNTIFQGSSEVLEVDTPRTGEFETDMKNLFIHVDQKMRPVKQNTHGTYKYRYKEFIPLSQKKLWNIGLEPITFIFCSIALFYFCYCETNALF